MEALFGGDLGDGSRYVSEASTATMSVEKCLAVCCKAAVDEAGASAAAELSDALALGSDAAGGAAGARPSQGVLENAAGKALIHHLVRRPEEVAAQVEARVHDVATREVMLSSVVPLLCQAALRWERISGGGGGDSEKQPQQQPQAQSAALTFLACFLPLPQPQEEGAGAGAASAAVEQAPPTYAALLVCVAASPALCAFFEETPEDVRQEAQRIVELSTDEGLGVPQASTEAAAAAAAAAAPSPASDARAEELKDTVTAAVFTSIGQLEKVARSGASVVSAAAATDVAAPPTKLQVAAVQALVAFLSVVHSRGAGGAAGDDLLWRCLGSVEAALRLLRGWAASFRPLLPAACDALLERLQAMAELRRCRAAAEHNARRVGAGNAEDAAAARAASARDAAALHCVVLLAGSLAEPMQAARLPRRFTLQPTAVAAAAEAAAASGAEAFEASIETFLRRRRGRGGAEEEAAVAAAAAVERLAGLLRQRVRGERPLFEDVAAAYVAVGALSKTSLDGLLAAAGAAGASEPAERARGALTGLCRTAMALLAGRRSSADEALRGDCDRERSLASAALAGVLKRVRKAGGGGGGEGGFAPDVAAAELAQLVARCGEPAVAVAVETAVVQYRTRRSANGVVLLIKELLGLCVNPAAVGSEEAAKKKKKKNTLGLGTLYEDSDPVCVDACVSAVWQLLAEVAPSAVLGGLAADGLAAPPAEEEATASFVASELFKVADSFAAGDAGKAARVQLAAVFARLAFRHTVAPLLSRVVRACVDPAAAATAGSAGHALAEYLRQRKDGGGGGGSGENAGEASSGATGGAEASLQKIQRKLAAKRTGSGGDSASDDCGAFFAVETLEKVAAAYAAQRGAAAAASAAGDKRKQKKKGGKRRSRSSAATATLCDESVEFPVLLLNAALTHLRAEGHAFSHNLFEELLEETDEGEEGTAPPPSPLLPQRALVTPADLYALCADPAAAAGAGASTAAATPVLVQLCGHLASVWAAAVPAKAWGSTAEGSEGEQTQLLRCRYSVGDFRLLLPPPSSSSSSSPRALAKKREEEEEASGATHEEAPPRAASAGVRTRFELLCGVLFDEPSEELVMSASCAAVAAAAGAVARAALAGGGGEAAASASADAAAVVCGPLLRRLEETLGGPVEADEPSHSLFDQLAPLLLLRNVPAVYCAAAPVRHALLGVMLRGIGAADAAAAGLPPLPPQVLGVAADLAPRCVAGCYSFAGTACCGEPGAADVADGCGCAAVTRLADALVARMPAAGGDAEEGLKKVLLFVCRTAVSVIGSCAGEVAAFAAPATGGGGGDAATGGPVELLQGLVLRAVARAGGVAALRTTAVFAAVTDAVSLVCAAEVRSFGLGAVARRRPSLWTLLDGAAEEREEDAEGFYKALVTPQALVSTIAYLSKGDLSAVALGGPVSAAGAAHARGVPEVLFASVLRYALGEVERAAQHKADARAHLELLFNSIYHWQASSSAACVAQLRTRADDLLGVCVRHLADPYPVNHTALKLVGVVLSAASAEEKAATFVASVAQALAPLTDPQRNNPEVASLASRLLSFLVA